MRLLVLVVLFVGTALAEITSEERDQVRQLQLRTHEAQQELLRMEVAYMQKRTMFLQTAAELEAEVNKLKAKCGDKKFDGAKLACMKPVAPKVRDTDLSKVKPIKVERWQPGSPVRVVPDLRTSDETAAAETGK